MRRLASAVAAVLLLFAACATGPSVQVIPRDELPAELYGSGLRPPSDERLLQVVLYFVRTDAAGVPLRPPRLGAVTREEMTALPLASLAMRALLDRPTDEEVRAGLRTAIPRETDFFRVSVESGVAEVDVSAEFEAPSAQEEHIIRLAQVVWTLTELAEVDSVRFRVHGAPQMVIDQAGEVHDRVGRGRYSRLAPREPEAPGLLQGPLVPEAEQGP